MLASVAGIGAYLLRAPSRAGVAREKDADSPARIEAGLLQAVREDPRNSHARLELIGFYLSHRRGYDALAAARAAHEEFPDEVPVALGLAEALRATARYPDAIEVLRSLPKDSAEAKLALARYLVTDGKVREGIRVLQTLRHPDPTAALQAGQIYLDALAPKQAVQVLAPALAADAGNLTLRTTTGLAYLAGGSYKEAIRVLQPAVDQAPGVAPIRYYLGSALRLSGDLTRLAEAENHLRIAVEQAPTEPLFLYELALARVQLRAWDGALEAMERCSALKPDLPEVDRDLGRIYLRLSPPRTADARVASARYFLALKQPSRAVQELREAYAQEPGNRQVAMTYAFAVHETGQAEQSVQVLAKLREAAPNDTDVQWELLRAQRSAGKLADALATLDALPDPSATEVVHERADLLQRMERYPESEEALTLLRDRNPEDPVRHYELGLFSTLWSRKPDRDAIAESSFRRALELQPEYVGAHYRLGSLYERLGRADEAVSHLRRAHELAPSLWEALRPLGRAHARLRQKEQADECFAVYRRAQAKSEEKRRLELLCSGNRATRESRRRLIDFLLETGDFGAATRELEVFHHAYPDDVKAAEQLAALYGRARRFQRQFEITTALRSGMRPAP